MGFCLLLEFKMHLKKCQNLYKHIQTHTHTSMCLFVWFLFVCFCICMSSQQLHSWCQGGSFLSAQNILSSVSKKADAKFCPNIKKKKKKSVKSTVHNIHVEADKVCALFGQIIWFGPVRPSKVWPKTFWFVSAALNLFLLLREEKGLLVSSSIFYGKNMPLWKRQSKQGEKKGGFFGFGFFFFPKYFPNSFYIYSTTLRQFITLFWTSDLLNDLIKQG